MSRRRGPAAAALGVALAITAACAPGRGDGGRVSLTVLAAASLVGALPLIGEAFSEADPSVEVRFSFAGTDALVAQIEQGAPADVFAGAAGSYAERLAEGGQIEGATVFCTNRLVVAVPASNPAGIRSVADLQGEGVRLVIAAQTVPVGAYARQALARLDAVYGDGFSERALANAVSEEDDSQAVLTKVRLGEADAGIVYVTDAVVAGEDVGTIDLPAEARVVAGYPIAALRRSEHPEEARAFVRFVLGPTGRRILAEAGFRLPPR